MIAGVWVQKMTPTTKPERIAGHGRYAPSRRLVAAITVSLLFLAGCGRSGPSDGTAQTTSSIIVTTQPVTTATTAPPTTAPQQLTYLVQSGDSLSIIAERFGVSTKELADFNAITDSDTIKIGQELSIPPTTEAPPTTVASDDAQTTTT
jgi:LysM repeat protein